MISNNRSSLESPGPPLWWHAHGMKMEIEPIGSVNPNHAELGLGSRAANLEIGWSNDRRHPEAWVNWSLIQPRGASKGTVRLQRDELAATFGVIEKPEGFQSMTELMKYQASCMVHGSFMRSGRYLNIPGPGTGWDGDPNISIYLSDEIVDAVGAMIQKHAALFDIVHSGTLAFPPDERDR